MAFTLLNLHTFFIFDYKGKRNITRCILHAKHTLYTGRWAALKKTE